MHPVSRISILTLTMVAALVASVSRCDAQTTQPTSRPAMQPTTQPASAGDMLDQMLKPPPGSAGMKPLQPSQENASIDRTTGKAAVAPGADSMNVMREGTFIVDRTGRLSRAADGQQTEFTFDADGRTMKDPPVVILPNLKLTAMENAVKASNRDLKFRITGMVTEYRGRNYILLEKVVVVPDVVDQFGK